MTRPSGYIRDNRVLDYDPDAISQFQLTNPTSLQLTAGDQVLPSGGVFYDSGTDYVLLPSTSRMGAKQINGGRRKRMIGGELHIPAGSSFIGALTFSQNDYIGSIYLQDVHIINEASPIDIEGDGMRFAGTKNCHILLQNCVITGVHGGGGLLHEHADLIQAFGGALSLTIIGGYGWGNTQGLQIDPDTGEIAAVYVNGWIVEYKEIDGGVNDGGIMVTMTKIVTGQPYEIGPDYGRIGSNVYVGPSAAQRLLDVDGTRGIRRAVFPYAVNDGTSYECPSPATASADGQIVSMDGVQSYRGRTSVPIADLGARMRGSFQDVRRGPTNRVAFVVGGLAGVGIGATTKEYRGRVPTELATADSAGANVAELKWSHKIPTGANRLLLVYVAVGASKPISDVSAGRFPLTKLTGLSVPQASSGGTARRSEVWMLINPPAGETLQINARLVPGNGSTSLAATSQVLTGASQTDPIRTPVNTGTVAPGTSLAASTTGTGSAANDLIVIAAGAIRSTATPTVTGTGTITTKSNRVTGTNLVQTVVTQPAVDGAALTTMAFTPTDNGALVVFAVKKP